MNKPYNQLTDAEAERLAKLIEELAEASQAACKILRHGYESFDPTSTEPLAESNRKALHRELLDVSDIVQRMFIADDFRQVLHPFSAPRVMASQKWMHHQPDSYNKR